MKSSLGLYFVNQKCLMIKNVFCGKEKEIVSFNRLEVLTKIKAQNFPEKKSVRLNSRSYYSMI